MSVCPACGMVLTAREASSSVCPVCGASLRGGPPAGEHADAQFTSVTDAADTANVGDKPTKPAFSDPVVATRPTLIRRFLESIGSLGIRVLGLLLILGLFFAVAQGIEFYNKYIRANVWVYVDNGDAVPITVLMDGKSVGKIAPKKVAIIKTRSGKRRFLVKRGGETVYEETHTLQGPERRGLQRYILNPDGKRRYWVKTVKYGFALPDFRIGRSDPFSEYRQLGSEIDIVRPPERWIKLPKVDLMMDEKIPQSVQGNFSDSREAVRWINRHDYDLVLDARTTDFSKDPRFGASLEKRREFEKELEGRVDELEACVKRLLSSGRRFGS